MLAQETAATWPAVALAAAGVLMVLCAALAGVVRWFMKRVDSLTTDLKDLKEECRTDRRRLAAKLVAAEERFVAAEEDRDRLHEQNGRQQRELDTIRRELDILKAQPPRV